MKGIGPLVGIIISIVVAVTIFPTLFDTIEEVQEELVEGVVVEEEAVVSTDTGSTTEDPTNPFGIALSVITVVLSGVGVFLATRKFQKSRIERLALLTGSPEDVPAGLITKKKEPRFTIFGIGIG